MKFREGRKGLKTGRCRTCNGRMVFQPTPKVIGDMVIPFNVRIVPFHGQDDCRCYIVLRTKVGKRQRRHRGWQR